MSGGHFEYNQYRIREIADQIEDVIYKNGKEKTEEELSEWSHYDPEYFERYPDEKYHYKYPDEVIAEFKKGLDILRQAEVYAQRIDWLLSGDDGDETFLERLKEDLSELK
jgi:hypothetical protein